MGYPLSQSLLLCFLGGALVQGFGVVTSEIWVWAWWMLSLLCGNRKLFFFGGSLN